MEFSLFLAQFAKGSSRGNTIPEEEPSHISFDLFSFKTVSQMFMLILLIADLGGAFNMIAQVLIWVSLVLTIVSLIDYIAKNVQVLTQGGM